VLGFLFLTYWFCQGVGIPIILLHDGEGAIVSVELKSGEMVRGYLEDAEDNMNCTLKVKIGCHCIFSICLIFFLKDATRTGADGKRTNHEYIFLRGSQILFIVFPSMLKNAPMFKRINIWRKYKGHPPQNLGTATGPRGQAGAILRKGFTVFCAIVIFLMCIILCFFLCVSVFSLHSTTSLHDTAVQRQDAFGVR
jgi:small nuclear ribonucleoprotein D3